MKVQVKVKHCLQICVYELELEVLLISASWLLLTRVVLNLHVLLSAVNLHVLSVWFSVQPSCYFCYYNNMLKQ